MKPFTDVRSALEFVRSFQGSAADLRLPIDDSTQDLLGRGWEPDGYEQGDGYRIYKYKEWKQ